MQPVIEERNNGKFKKGVPRPENAGRKKGSKNKKTLAAHLKAQEMNIDPFEMLLLFAANRFEELGYAKQIPMDIRFNAVKEACTYMLPKKRSVEIVAEDQEPLPDRPFAFMPDPRGE